MVSSSLRRLLVVALLCGTAPLLGSGCAASKAYRQGMKESKAGNWDLAVARLTVALQKSPDNLSYKIALENARVEASRFHYREARKAMAAEELDKAADELEIAVKFDGGNKSAIDDRVIVRDKIRKREEDKQRRADCRCRCPCSPRAVRCPALSSSTRPRSRPSSTPWASSRA
jgi:hypothetical protein